MFSSWEPPRKGSCPSSSSGAPPALIIPPTRRFQPPHPSLSGKEGLSPRSDADTMVPPPLPLLSHKHRLPSGAARGVAAITVVDDDGSGACGEWKALGPRAGEVSGIDTSEALEVAIATAGGTLSVASLGSAPSQARRVLPPPRPLRCVLSAYCARQAPGGGSCAPADASPELPLSALPPCPRSRRRSSSTLADTAPSPPCAGPPPGSSSQQGEPPVSLLAPPKTSEPSPHDAALWSHLPHPTPSHFHPPPKPAPSADPPRASPPGTAAPPPPPTAPS